MKQFLKLYLFLVVIFGLPLYALAVTSPLNQGGTGWATSTAGDLLTGTTSPLQYTRLQVGTPGQVLWVTGGQPAWVATSSLGITGLPIGGTVFQVLGNSSTNNPAWVNSTSTAVLNVDVNRTDSYTQNGSYLFPFKSLSSAIASSTGFSGYAYILSPGTYVDGAPDTFPSAPFTIQGNQATYVPASGATTASSFDIYDLTIAGSLTETDNSLTSIHQFNNGVITGNLTLAGNATLSGMALTGTTSTLTIKGGALVNIVGSINYAQTINNGTLNYNDDQVVASTTQFAIISTTTGSTLNINGMTLIQNGSGGGINVQNGATSTVNNISNLTIISNSTTPGSTLNAGTARTFLCDYNDTNLQGNTIYATGSNWVPCIDGALAVQSTSTLMGFVNIAPGPVGINSSTPTANLVVQGTSTTPTIPVFVVGSSTSANLFTVLANGTVGVNTSTPFGTGIIIRQRAALNNAGFIAQNLANNNSIRLWSDDSQAGRLSCGATDACSIGILGANGGGNVIIGGTSGSQRLEVLGNIYANSGADSLFMANRSGTGNVGSLNLLTGGSTQWRFGLLNSANDLIIQAGNPGAAYVNILKTNGYVGIGTSSPLAALHIMDFTASSGPTVIIQATSTQTSNLTEWRDTRQNSNTVLSVVDILGSMGVGTSTPIARLAITGTTTKDTLVIASSTGAVQLIVKASGNVGIGSSTPNYGFVANGTVAMPNLTTSAGLQTGVVCVGAGGELINDSVACLASAKRFKQDIQPLNVGLDEVMQFQPVQFNWTKAFNAGFENDPNKNGIQYSLIADDVQKIDPKMATVVIAGKDKGKVAGLADLNHWVALFVQSFKDIQTEIIKLTFRLNTHDAQIQSLQLKTDKQDKQIKLLQQEIIQLQLKSK